MLRAVTWVAPGAERGQRNVGGADEERAALGAAEPNLWSGQLRQCPRRHHVDDR